MNPAEDGPFLMGDWLVNVSYLDVDDYTSAIAVCCVSGCSASDTNIFYVGNKHFNLLFTVSLHFQTMLPGSLVLAHLTLMLSSSSPLDQS